MSKHHRLTRTVCGLVLLFGAAHTASAQSSPPARPPAITSDETRPATTTFFGDTGLWYVPTAEVLPAGKWSTGVYRRGTNYIQGYTNVGDFAATFAYGVKDRVEVFGSFLIDTRIDRDTRPLFFSDQTLGGIVERYPGVTTTWSGNHLGDLYLGAKVNLMSEAASRPLAIAVRAMFKVPTGNTDAGVSTGKLDTIIDVIASREVSQVVELSGFAGMEFRGNADGFDLPRRAFRWGVGAGFPTRFALRGFAELSGALPSSDTARITSAELTGPDFSHPPLVSDTEKLTRLTFGVTYQARNGFFVGAGLSRNMPTQKRNLALASEGSFTDYTDWQLRIGFHPGVRRRGPSSSPSPLPLPLATPLPTPAPQPPMPIAAPVIVLSAPDLADHTLTVKAECDPCTVEIGKTSTATATAKDSIGCALIYSWSAPAGLFADRTRRSTLWTAPGQDRLVPLTVTATCPTDGKTASDTVDIQMPAPPVKTYTFEDVYFDFDRSATLRPEAMLVLDEAVSAMKKDPALTLTVEGYSCDVGTAEYNLALAKRRALVVRDYFVSHGIAADRLQTVSFGEEYAKYDNSREETRLRNRRVALVVILAQKR